MFFFIFSVEVTNFTIFATQETTIDVQFLQEFFKAGNQQWRSKEWKVEADGPRRRPIEASIHSFRPFKNAFLGRNLDQN